MARFLHRYFICLRRNAGVAFLAACFLSGLFFGVWMSYGVEFSVSLMRGVMDSAVSIVSLLGVLLLPLLFSALAVYFSKPRWLFGIAFLKAFSFAFVSAGICTGFGSAGWLVRSLILFSDGLSLPLLWLYWLRHIPGRRTFQAADVMVIAGCIGSIGLLDQFLIIPLLRGI